MIFPIESLLTDLREVGLVVAVLIGFGFGFVLENAGFGRANKLAAQFYLTDMTVFKVMFGAIVTAMLGIIVLDGLGVVSLAAISGGAASATFLWPMAVGGFAFGAGFVISGYCPGTSVVATASGNLDGLVALAGITIGSLLYGEVFPLIQTFHTSGARGQLFLYQWLDLPPAWVAVIVTGIAIGGFIGGEAVERWMARRGGVEVPTDQRAKPKRFAFGLYGAVALVALITLLFPVEQTARARDHDDITDITAETLARRILDEPWKLRILDLRAREACAQKRVTGAECVPLAELDMLGLGYARGGQDLILVENAEVREIPAAAAAYPGRVLVLRGGFAAWNDLALGAPGSLSADATPEEVATYRFRAGLNNFLTGQRAAPPPAAVKAFVPKKKKKGGGCE